jgi:hypothetical protein
MLIHIFKPHLARIYPVLFSEQTRSTPSSMQFRSAVPLRWLRCTAHSTFNDEASKVIVK